MINKQADNATPLCRHGQLDASAFLSTLINGQICTHFQPILSLKQHCIVGVEALSRVQLSDGRHIPPADFFAAAIQFNRTIETDRLCRSKALSAFHGIRNALRPKQDPLLFLNIDTTILDKGVARSGVLLSQAQTEGIEPENIVIEIVESCVHDLDALKEFTEFYRRQGFMIALDDVGSGHSNFDRFAIIRPDIIKIDRSIISEIHNDFYKQETFRALVQLSRKIGTLVLAEGVETEEEALCVLNCDADMLQGYFFARPAPNWEQISGQLHGKPKEIAEKLRNYKVRKINCIREMYQLYNSTIEKLTCRLAEAQPETFAAILENCIKQLPFIEAVYVLNDQGIMETDTILQHNSLERRGKLFQTARRGDDLSLKEYFYLLIFSGLQHYATDSYTSLATGNLTRTISCTFHDKSGHSHVLCVDVLGELNACPCQDDYDLRPLATT